MSLVSQSLSLSISQSLEDFSTSLEMTIREGRPHQPLPLEGTGERSETGLASRMLNKRKAGRTKNLTSPSLQSQQKSSPMAAFHFSYYNTCERKAFVRSSFVCSKTSSGRPSSTMTPPSMKRTREPTSLANPISCVTHDHGHALFCDFTHDIQDFMHHFRSSAEVGSSKRSAFGFIASARAIATRCCCPPESCGGL